MAAINLVVFVLFQFGLSAATNTLDEPVESIDDLAQNARDNVTNLFNNFKDLVVNTEKDGNNLLLKLKIQSSDPEGLLALVTEAKLAISYTTPAGVDVSSCTNGNGAKYQSMIQEAGPGVQACLQNASAALQPYFQYLESMISTAQKHMEVVDGNITDCVNTNQDNFDGVAACLNAVGVRVSNGNNNLKTALLGEIAAFWQQVPAMVAVFTVCTNNVQDKAISESVDIIMTTRKCIQNLNSAATS